MKCPNCGAENGEKAQFCQLCFAKFTNSKNSAAVDIKKEEETKKKKQEKQKVILGILFIALLIAFWVVAKFWIGLIFAIIGTIVWKLIIAMEADKQIAGKEATRYKVGFFVSVLVLTLVIGAIFSIEIVKSPEPEIERTELDRKHSHEDGDFIDPVPTMLERQIWDDLQREYDQNPNPLSEPPVFASEDEWEEWDKVLLKIDKECEQRVADRYGISLEELQIIRFKVVTSGENY